MATTAEITRELTRAVELVTGRIGVAVINNTRQATPRDTAWHASRWVGAAGREPSSIDTPNTRAGRAAALSFNQQANSLSALSAYRITQGDIFIGNDGNYIETLNATRGNFVEGAINRSLTISLAGTGLR